MRDRPSAHPYRPTRAKLGPLVAVLLLAGLSALAGPAATPANAHAAVVATTPARKAVLGYSPTEVTVRFSEPVSLVPGRAQVLAPDGRRINAGEPSVRGDTLRIPIRAADRPLGTYLVSYRVVSADSHPVAGGYTFAVGAESAAAPTLADDPVRPDVRIAVPLIRYVGYAGLVLLIGPTLLLALLWPARLSRRGPVRLVRAGLALVAAGALAGLWVQAPYTSGAGLFDVSATELRQVIGSGYGLVLCARLGILLLVAALLPPLLQPQGRAPSYRILYRKGPLLTALVLLLGVAGLATWPLAGHAIASPMPLASAVADVLHLAAASAWLGGLVTLAAFLLRAAHPRTLGVILPVWSRWATVAVLWLVAAGAAQALIEIGTPGALVGTDYGRLVLAKVALLGLVLTGAALARRLVRRGGAGTAPGRLRRLVGLEVAVSLVILGLSAALVQTTPGRSAGTEVETAAASDTFAQTLESPLYTLQFDIYPVQLGEHNTVHAYLYTPDGKPLPAVEWTLTTALPALGVEPVATPMLGVQPHHAVGAVNFPVAGQWQLRFTVRTSDIDQASVTTTVRVR
ncbi:copper resistance protein CopC [Plantactinospora sp. CA-290183]|uniref:copper resistance CopC/CopD family protein n=1 Tax=Plantactinospora sp. CA-290183 TaxID=3240006 RepID=UPI003D8DB9E4